MGTRSKVVAATVPVSVLHWYTYIRSHSPTFHTFTHTQCNIVLYTHQRTYLPFTHHTFMSPLSPPHTLSSNICTYSFPITHVHTHTARIGNSIIYFGGYNANLRRHFGDVFMVNTGTQTKSHDLKSHCSKQDHMISIPVLSKVT